MGTESLACSNEKKTRRASEAMKCSGDGLKRNPDKKNIEEEHTRKASFKLIKVRWGPKRRMSNACLGGFTSRSPHIRGGWGIG